MKVPGFVAEASLRLADGGSYRETASLAASNSQRVEPSYRCSLYLVAKCLLNGESDCWQRHCPIVE